MELQRFLASPDSSNLDLVDFYTKFISTFSTRLNQLTFVRMVARIPSQIKGIAITYLSRSLIRHHLFSLLIYVETDKKIEFLKAVSELPKVVQDQEAFIDSRSTLAACLIENGNLPGAKVFVASVN